MKTCGHGIIQTCKREIIQTIHFHKSN